MLGILFYLIPNFYFPTIYFNCCDGYNIFFNDIFTSKIRYKYLILTHDFIFLSFYAIIAYRRLTIIGGYNYMSELKINWQRLVSEGETCPRCGSTEENLEKAVSSLEKSINPLGLNVVLNKKKLSVEEFENSPLDSNLISINDKPLKYWINGKVGESQCCDICGPNDCRTVTINGETYEEIPAELIIKAGLKAASDMIDSKKEKSCCDQSSSASNSTQCC